MPACSRVFRSDMTAGFVGYQANTLRQINLDEIGSEGYAFLMEMKFELHRHGARAEFPIILSSENPESQVQRKIRGSKASSFLSGLS